MRPVVRTAVGVVVVVSALVGGFLGGWYLHTPAASTAGPTSSTLGIIAAGSLAPILPSFASAFANQTSGVDASAAAQLYEGSTAAATALSTETHSPYDLFISADFRVIPQHLEAPTSTVATWEAVFASDPVVLAYAPGVSALSGINTTNWFQKVTASGVTLGVANASADPLGANALFVLELQDALAHQSGALYGHFFNGALGALATPTSSAKFVAENVAQSALSTGEVSAYLIYRSYAQVDHLTYVSLSSSVNLGATDPSNVSLYGTVSTTILSGTSTKSVAGAPVLFALTVPTNAPNVALGVAFAAYLLSNATSSMWAADGFQPISPAWVDAPAHVPAALSGFAPDGLPPLPADLASLLA
ncbi:MAG: substrate-binding domain-containing protein [Thermoplasmata archaeon]|nr:substrate-binding domain-containing protein [Thermoplasmata archaeon]